MIRIKNSTKNKFREQLRDQKVVCICAGTKFREFMIMYSDVKFDCLYVLDNDTSKKFIEINGMSYPIKPMSAATEEVKNALIILTSAKFSNEIIKQVDDIEMFDDMDIYIPELFEPDYSYYDFSNVTDEIIPRKIHYCWFGKNELPAVYQKNIESWKKYCPDYELIRWDENNYDVDKCKYMSEAYKKGMYAFVSDYSRLDVIYTYGGIYLDVDVEMLRPWDELLSFPLFCGFENEKYISFGLGFGAVCGNEIIKKMMQEYEKISFPDQEKGEQLITCPVYQTNILKQYGLICDGKSRNYINFLALSPVYFAPVNRMDGIWLPHKESFSIHHYAGSWLSDEINIEKNNKIRKNEYLIKHM